MTYIPGKHISGRTFLLCALLALLAGSTAARADGSLAGTLELASRVDPGAFSSTGSGNGQTPFFSVPSLSQNGRFVAFLSSANNLVPGQIDLNAAGGEAANDVFLYDRVARTTALVSHAVDSTATTGDAESKFAAISADGRWVVFASRSTNLTDGLEGAFTQYRLFLYDRVSTAVTLVSSSTALESADCPLCGAVAAAISTDGRFVAFVSTAPDLVPDQPAGFYNVFLYDRTTGKTILVSRSGNGYSADMSLSADGRFIAFDRQTVSDEGYGDVYLYDHASDALTRVGPGSNPTISADGSSVAFVSASSQVIPGEADPNGSRLDVFLYSRTARTTVLVSHAVGSARTAANAGSNPSDSGESLVGLLLSADGRFLAFLSSATNLVPRQPGGSRTALFLYDRASGASVLASRSASSPGKLAPLPLPVALSADGRFLLFASDAAYLFDRKSGSTTRIPVSGSAGISADGSEIAFYSAAANLVPGVRDTNGANDLFLYSVAQRTTVVASLHAPGLASVTPAADSVLRGVSADGRWVLFEGTAPDLAGAQVDGNARDIFLYDHVTKQITLVSHKAGAPATAGDGASSGGTLSADGRYAAFTSYATNLDATVTDFVVPATGKRLADVFLFDRVTGKITALSRAARHPDVTANGDSMRPVISADGRWIAFVSTAGNLTLPGAAIGNVYFYDRAAGALTRTGAFIAMGTAPSPPALTPDGRYLAYLSSGADGVVNVYLLDRVSGFSTLVSHGPLGETAGASSFQTLGLSADGRFVAFTSLDPDLGGVHGGYLNVYLFDRETGGVALLGSSVGRQDLHPSLSADGRWATFLSNDNPTGLDQVVLYDRVAGTSIPLSAAQGNAAGPTITPDGRKIVFSDDAPDLLPDLTGAVSRIYEYDRDNGTLSLLAPGSGAPLPSTDGHAVAFESLAPLVARDFNGRQDVYLFTQAP